MGIGRSCCAGYIEQRVRDLFGEVPRGIPVHIYLHGNAEKKPNGGRYRILTPVGKGSWQLFRPGDFYHPDREGSKTYPRQMDIPAVHHDLIPWYLTDYAERVETFGPDHPMLALAGIGDSGLGDLAERHDYYLAEQEDPLG